MMKQTDHKSKMRFWVYKFSRINISARHLYTAICSAYDTSGKYLIQDLFYVLAQLSCICNKHLYMLDIYLNTCKTLKIEDSQVEFTYTFAKVAFPLYFTLNVKPSDAVLST